MGRLRLQSTRSLLSWTAGAAAALLAAWYFALNPSPTLAVGLPLLLLMSIAVTRYPSVTMSAAVLLDSAYGSAKAFLHLPANGIATGLMLGLTIGVIGTYLFRRRAENMVVWPGGLLLGAYLLFLLADLPFSPEFSPALKVARTAGLWILVIFPVAYGPWSQAIHERVRRSIVFVAVGVGAYAAIRWRIGAAAQEKALAALAQYNQTSGHAKVQGSFPNGADLGLWTAAMIPFLLMMALTRRGLVRLAAATALPLCTIGLIGSGKRAGLVAAAAGVAIVMFAYLFGRGMPRGRIAVAAVAAAIVVGGGAVIVPSVLSNPSDAARYSNLFHPTQDASVQLRLDKWRQALSDLHGHPFGFGLGTTGPESEGQRFITKAGEYVDNGYIRLAYEQGLGVMALYVAGLLVLLIGLLRRGLTAPDPLSGGAAIGAAGTLAAFIITMGTDIVTASPLSLVVWIVIAGGMAPFTRRLASTARAAFPGRLEPLPSPAPRAVPEGHPIPA